MNDDLRGFGETALRAVALADAEAHELGLEYVGTEHLLIGLLAADPAIATAMSRAGGTVAAARHKVRETAGDARPSLDAPTGPLPMTSRARRAIGRAVRFSHHDRSEVVETRHLLLGVLDVEGTAGQVLRGIGVDVAALRTSLQAKPDPVPEVPAPPAPPAPAPVRSTKSVICPACGAAIDDQLTYRVVPARGADGASVDALVFSCGACGAAVGVSRA